MANNAMAKLEDAREVAKCQYHHTNFWGKETHVAPAKVMVDDKRIYFVWEESGKVIHRMRVGTKSVINGGLVVAYEGFFVNPLFPLTILFGGLGGYKTMKYNAEKSAITYSSYLYGAGERTFEEYETCDQIEGDEAQLAKLFPHKLKKEKSKKPRQVYSKYFSDIEVKSYQKPEDVRDSTEYFNATCQVSVDQEDTTYPGGDSPARQSWNLYTGHNQTVSEFVSMCKNLEKKFIENYVGGLDTPPDMTRTMLYLFDNNSLGTDINVGKVETIDGLKTISYDLDNQDENELEWICRMNYRQADLSPGGSSYAEMKWMLTGSKQAAVVACNMLLKKYKTLYIDKLDNPINNEKSILVQMVDQDDVEE